MGIIVDCVYYIKREDFVKQLTRINKSDRPVKILQFGEGNFLRAFVDNFFQVLNEKELFNGSICVVQPLSFGRVKDL
ncbi:MAG: hypothetical protein GX232_04305, partial [Acholeplasmataceae bacterium]|nr:hypothetical protein [Acholeplasmataceae bacterium]